MRQGYAFTILIGLSAVSACGSHAPHALPTDQASLVAGGSGTAQITYQPVARVMERDRGKAILAAVSQDGWVLAFQAGAPELNGLRASDVLVVKHALARTVVAADTANGFVYVLTQNPSLGDVIRQGHVEFNAPIRFGQRTASRDISRPLHQLADFVVPTAYAQESKPGYDPDPYAKARKEGTTEAAKRAAKAIIVDGWKTTFVATPGTNRVDLSLTLTKDVGGFRALITGEGYLTDFDMSAKIDVDQGVVDRLESVSKKMNGVMNFTWEAGTATPGAHTGDTEFKLPTPIKIPLAEFVAGLPLFLEIGGAIIVKPAFSGGSEYSHGSFRVTYDGYQNFIAKEGTIDANGNVKGDIKFLESQNISPLAPHGFVLAVAAPRVELKLGMAEVVKDWKQVQEAADAVDKWEERLLKKVLSPEQYDAFEKSPAAGLKIGKVVKSVVASDADAFIELVTSTGESFSGLSVILPCTRTDIHVKVKVGASAQAMGQSVGEAEKEIFSKDFSRVDPPEARLCKTPEEGGN